MHPVYSDDEYMSRVTDGIDSTMTRASSAESSAEDGTIRVTYAWCAKRSGRKLGRKLGANSVATGVLVRLVCLVSGKSRIDELISRGACERPTDGVYAPVKCACYVQQHVVELLLPRADSSAARSQRSVRHDPGGVPSSGRKRECSRELYALGDPSLDLSLARAGTVVLYVSNIAVR